MFLLKLIDPVINRGTHSDLRGGEYDLGLQGTVVQGIDTHSLGRQGN